MLGGGSSISSLSSLMGGGSARTQAMSTMQQMDTFERLLSFGTESTGAYSVGSAKGTVREQAKEIMKEYEKSVRAEEETAAESTEAPKDAETAEAAESSAEAEE